LEGADLSKLDLRNINFKYANLRGARLTGANLSWSVLERADLSHANLEVTQSYCSHIYTTFSFLYVVRLYCYAPASSKSISLDLIAQIAAP
jgi:ribosomal protein L15E